MELKAKIISPNVPSYSFYGLFSTLSFCTAFLVLHVSFLLSFSSTMQRYSQKIISVLSSAHTSPDRASPTLLVCSISVLINAPSSLDTITFEFRLKLGC